MPAPDVELRRALPEDAQAIATIWQLDPLCSPPRPARGQHGRVLYRWQIRSGEHLPLDCNVGQEWHTFH